MSVFKIITEIFVTIDSQPSPNCSRLLLGSGSYSPGSHVGKSACRVLFFFFSVMLGLYTSFK